MATADIELAPTSVHTSSTGPASTTRQQQQDLESRAKQFIAQEKFNRKLSLPATDAHGELAVTYALGGIDSDNAPTVLFIGGMYGGRLLAAMADHVAQGLGMRVVVVDRPGMGSSTAVDISLRLKVWLETVPILLHTINAQRVSLAAHSCGAIYALNTIYQMPQILPPSNRKLYLFSPWVSTEHSGFSGLSVASYLPSPLINQFDSIVRGVNGVVVPSLAFSGAVSKTVSAPFTTTTTTTTASSQEGDGGSRNANVSKHERNDVCKEYCGVSAAENAVRSKEMMTALFSESTRGANHEAMLALRKAGVGSWGVADDYAAYPSLLAAKMRDFFSREAVACMQSVQSSANENEPENEPASSRSASFAIKTFWAEKDMMISKKGEAYFNKCFDPFTETHSSDEDSEHIKYLKYEYETIPGTDHDTVCLPQYGGISRIMRDMLGLS